MEKVITVCPYCASGCKINLKVENGKIIGAEGANGHTNEGELCLKLEVVSWEEAIEFASSRLLAIKEKYGPKAIMTTGSSRGPGNEANFVMQKFVRAAVGSNNIDCCARV